MRFCHVAYCRKRIEILLNHIRDKNKFKSRLFISFGFSRPFFVTFFIQCSKSTICFIWFNVSRLFLSLIHKKLFTFTFTLSLLLLYIHILTAFHAIPFQIHWDKKRCHLPSTFQRHLHNSNIAVLSVSSSYE